MMRLGQPQQAPQERITLHICTKDRPAELLALLESLRQQTHTAWDLILIDQSQQPILHVHYIQSMISRLTHEKHRVVVQQSTVGGVVANRNQAFDVQEKVFPDVRFSCRIDDDSICEPTYLEKLYAVIAADEKIGAVGGVVPLYGGLEFQKDWNTWVDRQDNNGIFNFVSVDDNGKIHIGDDGGVMWYTDGILPSHHLRSSFMIRNDAAKKAGYYDVRYGNKSCFREETDFCFALLEQGYILKTDTSAICWHLRAPYGGCRTPDWMQSAQICEQYFQKKWSTRITKVIQ